MEFYNNKPNETLKFKINTEGVNLDTIETRLILLTKENKNCLFFGEIKDNICKFNIPELKQYEKNEKGNIKFEIISEDMYFPVWKDSFEIKTKSSISLDQLVNEVIKEDEKPNISATIFNEPVKIIKNEKKSENQKVKENIKPIRNDLKIKNFNNFS